MEASCSLREVSATEWAWSKDSCGRESKMEDVPLSRARGSQQRPGVLSHLILYGYNVLAGGLLLVSDLRGRDHAGSSG